jgi:hypothetical protein
LYTVCTEHLNLLTSVNQYFSQLLLQTFNLFSFDLTYRVIDCCCWDECRLLCTLFAVDTDAAPAVSDTAVLEAAYARHASLVDVAFDVVCIAADSVPVVAVAAAALVVGASGVVVVDVAAAMAVMMRDLPTYLSLLSDDHIEDYHPVSVSVVVVVGLSLGVRTAS